jgi:predicted alpha/beta-hydrolase family hydrolase
MTSQTQAEAPLPDVRGLAFLAFPLHPAGQPSDARAKHLHDVRIPMLFVQGTRDALADADLLVPLVTRLGDLARLEQIADGDHSFHVPARTGRTDREAMNSVLTALDAFITGLARQAPP